MRRRTFLGVAAGAAAWPMAARAQQGGKTPKIGFLGTGSPQGFGRIEGFRQGLRDLGYVEGRTIAVEYRWAEGRYERLPELAAELIRAKVDLIVTHATPGSLAAKRATTTIPIVMALVGDPVTGGIVESVAKPGGNITGQSFFNAELRMKRIELLKEIAPRIARVAVILNADNQAAESEFKAMETAAKSLNMELQPYRLRYPGDLPGALSEMAQAKVEAVETGDDQIALGNIGAVIAQAVKARLLTVGPEDVPRNGGIMGYGVDVIATYRYAAVLVDKILKGAKPGELPIERASKFQFILNLKAAKALGLEVPAATLLRADEVIE
jgi:putative ABC transport system substrate-binding protein